MTKIPNRARRSSYQSMKFITLWLLSELHMIHPWNMSVVTLEYFLNSVHFGERDLNSVNERVNFMTEFIDGVLLFNAEAWDNNMPYLGASGVSQKWTRDLAVKVPSCSKNTPKDQKPFQPQQKFQNREKKFFPGFLCRRFNFKICPQQNDDTCTTPWSTTLKLKHACGFQKPYKNYCLKKHGLLDHK